MNLLPVAIIGAGPVGLAAAATLIERGETPLILEAGATVGASVRAWGHVRMFSPWQYTLDAATVRLLEASGWQAPPLDELPTGHDLLDAYLLPFAALPVVREHLHLNTRVTAISRRNVDKMKDAARGDAPFVVHTTRADGTEQRFTVRAVIDASGTWTQPNPLGADGLPALGEANLQDVIRYGIPDVKGQESALYAGRRVLVVGSGHSAINALLDLADLKRTQPRTTIFWAMRGSNLTRVYGGGADDGLPARASLGTRMRTLVDDHDVMLLSPFRVEQVTREASGLVVKGDTDDGLHTLVVDRVIVATGSRPDTAMLRELRLDLDPALESPRILAPMIDPNVHSCGSVPPHGEAELRQPEKDFYVVGMKSYGRAPTFLLATGYEQVRSVVAALVGDWEAARDVRLVLPETGVCSTDLSSVGSCCAPAAPSPHVSLLDIAIVTNAQPIPVLTVGQCCTPENAC